MKSFFPTCRDRNLDFVPNLIGDRILIFYLFPIYPFSVTILSGLRMNRDPVFIGKSLIFAVYPAMDIWAVCY